MTTPSKAQWEAVMVLNEAGVLISLIDSWQYMNHQLSTAKVPIWVPLGNGYIVLIEKPSNITLIK